MIKVANEQLRMDGVPEELIPEIPKITLQPGDTPQKAIDLITSYWGDLYDGSILWEEE